MGELLEIFYAGLIIYFIYKLIFNLIVPVSKASANFRANVRQMNEQNLKQQQASAKPSDKKNSSQSEQEYIDFEEIK